MTWKKCVQKESERVGLRREDAPNRAKWKAGVKAIAVAVR